VTGVILSLRGKSKKRAGPGEVGCARRSRGAAQDRLDGNMVRDERLEGRGDALEADKMMVREKQKEGISDSWLKKCLTVVRKGGEQESSGSRRITNRHQNQDIRGSKEEGEEANSW